MPEAIQRLLSVSVRDSKNDVVLFLQVSKKSNINVKTTSWPWKDES